MIEQEGKQLPDKKEEPRAVCHGHSKLKAVLLREIKQTREMTDALLAVDRENNAGHAAAYEDRLRQLDALKREVEEQL